MISYKVHPVLEHKENRKQVKAVRQERLTRPRSTRTEISVADRVDPLLLKRIREHTLRDQRRRRLKITWVSGIVMFLLVIGWAWLVA